MTRALVVDDSEFMRTVIGNVLIEQGYTVQTANDGATALQAVREHDPDVITMDVEMPGVGGIEATERIMEEHPTPILMLSAHTDRGADATLEALSKGAVDFMPKPSGEGVDVHELRERLVEKLEAVERADLSAMEGGTGDRRSAAASDGGAVETVGGSDAASTTADPDAGPIGPADDGGVSAAGGATTETPTADPAEARPYVENPTIVIGASTGGPKVIERVLSSLPTALDPRIVVVQHMPDDFTGRLAARLDDVLPFDVGESADGHRVEGGEVVVARGGYHTEVSRYADGGLHLRLTRDAPVHGVRPAIDVTMETAAEAVTDPLVGVVLTGMGKDGADGVEAIAESGGHVVAQDRSTSPVFGIPRRAIATGAVDAVLPAGDIAAGICDALARDSDSEGDTDG